MKRLAAMIWLLAAAPLAAQAPAAAPQEEGAFHAELRREGRRIGEKCSGFGFKELGDCAIELATDHPLHVAFGTLAPQNGVGFGPALVMHYTPNENWRLNWSADVVGAISGAWRAGGYLKIVRTGVELPTVSTGPPVASSGAGIHPYPVIDVYAQTISLPKLTYFGLGPDSTRDGRSYYGMGESIVGSSVIYPIAASAVARLNLSLLGEINYRGVDIRTSDADDLPSIEQVYTEATAPGLASQPGFGQFGEGVRIKPSLANGHLQLNYMTRFQQFVAGDSAYSFRRWTLDLDHEIPLGGSARGAPPETANPNDCPRGTADADCLPVSRNRNGTINVRMFMARSGVSDTASVPFYFQPTLGGSDVNGNRGLASYEDYRFRGPHVLLFQESIERAIGSTPIGVWLASDQGRVSIQDGDGGTFRATFSAGLTLRAGGFPVVLLSFATGTSEGHHVALTISTSLLGGSSRPSLF
jgi:hypothetical protein